MAAVIITRSEKIDEAIGAFTEAAYGERLTFESP